MEDNTRVLEKYIIIIANQYTFPLGDTELCRIDMKLYGGLYSVAIFKISHLFSDTTLFEYWCSRNIIHDDIKIINQSVRNAAEVTLLIPGNSGDIDIDIDSTPVISISNRGFDPNLLASTSEEDLNEKSAVTSSSRTPNRASHRVFLPRSVTRALRISQPRKIHSE